MIEPIEGTLAALLGLQGFSVLDLDLPRAARFNDETMRVFQWIGIADDLADTMAVHPGAHFVDLDGKVLLDWPRPTAKTENGWYASYRLHQPDLERTLHAKLASIDGVKVRVGHVVEQVLDQGSHVIVDFNDGQHDQAGWTTAHFVVGCDGAHAVVRSALATRMKARSFEQR